jgi:hypothetical protein
VKFSTTLILFLLISVWNCGISQLFKIENFNKRTNWRSNRKEIQIGLCATQFNGDLGGAGGQGIDYSTKDIDWESTGTGLEISYKYRFRPYLATKTCLSYFSIEADDKYSEENMRKARNLHFKSNNFEVSQRLEFIFYANEFNGSFYNLTGRTKRRKSNSQLYVFGGIGFTTYNPKASYNGAWVPLRPLNTEGQSTSYKSATFIIPTGIGLRIGLTKKLRLGIEGNYTKTFSDYLDDVSTKYTDPSLLSSPAAIYLSNPSLAYTIGDKRGDSNQMDAYYRLTFQLIYNIGKR